MFNKVMNNEGFLASTAMGFVFGAFLIVMAAYGGHQFTTLTLGGVSLKQMLLGGGIPLAGFGVGVGMLKAIHVWMHHQEDQIKQEHPSDDSNDWGIEKGAIKVLDGLLLPQKDHEKKA